MKLYEMPKSSPYQRPFRVLSSLLIITFVGIYLLSAYGPPSLLDSTGRIIGMFAIGIVWAAIVGAAAFSAKEGMWRLKRGLRIELTDDRIIKRRDETATAEIPVGGIKSISQRRGWLIVEGGDPLRQISIPREIVGFEELKHDLAAFCHVEQLERRSFPRRSFPLVLMATSCLLLFLAHNSNVILIAGVALLLLQGWAISAMIQLGRSRPGSTLVLLAYVATMLLVIWITYMRVKASLAGAS